MRFDGEKRMDGVRTPINDYSKMVHAYDGVVDNVFTPDAVIQEKEHYWDVRTKVMVPEVLPCLFDTTVDFWLERIDIWGDLIITWKNPDTGRKEKITKAKLLNILTDDTMINLFGKWGVDKLSFKSVRISRKYIGLDGKKKDEEIIIDIDLTDDLKHSLKGKY